MAANYKASETLARAASRHRAQSVEVLGFGLARLWEALVEQVGWETMTFRSVREAEGWIQRRQKQEFGIGLTALATRL